MPDVAIPKMTGGFPRLASEPRNDGSVLRFIEIVGTIRELSADLASPYGGGGSPHGETERAV